MRFRACLVLGGLTFALFAVPIFGQPGNPKKLDDKKPAEPNPSVKLPITRVVLFNAGIGYFHREGTVTGNTRVDLKVNEEDVNDLILTLVTNDPAGGSRAVTYDNRAPADITLKAFSIDLTENPSVGNLLHQVRGEKVEITDAEGKTLTGNIVSVDKPTPTVIPGEPKTMAVGDGEVTRMTKPVVLPPAAGAVEQVAILTDDGLQTVVLSKIKKLKFSKPDLQTEFRKALEALAAARGANTKSVGVTFAGQGERKVSVGYVADAPLWKPTYRLMTGDAGTKLVGLAAVENTTDEDWENVRVALKSGRPITYKMDLYDPLYIPRPVIEPELYASLRPPVYQGVAMSQLGGAMGFGGGFGGQFGIQGGFGGGALGQVGNQGNLGVGGGIAGIGGVSAIHGRYAPHMSLGGYGGIGRPSVRSLLGERLDYDTRTNRLSAPPEPGAPRPPTNYFPNASELKNLGESFEYTVKDAVTLPRFKSALLPILDEKIEAQRLSIFNPEILGNHPLKGLRITNTSKFFVAQGPVTVYEGDTAAGQARLPDVKPGESRLLSYAIDLDVNLRKEVGDRTEEQLTVTLTNGTLGGTKKVRETTRYVVVNKSAEAKTVWVTQAIRDAWKLVTPEKPVEQSPQLYRFEVKVPANGSAKLDVVEEQVQLGLADNKLTVKPETVADVRTPVSVAVENGNLKEVTRVRSTIRYAFANAGTKERVVQVYQSVTDRKLISPDATPENAEGWRLGFHRFTTTVPPKGLHKFDIVEEWDQKDARPFVGLSVEAIDAYLKAAYVAPAVKAALGQLRAVRVAEGEAVAGIAEGQAALKEIAEEQTRIRANIERVPKDSEAYKRYLKKFDDQETEIEKHQAKLKELTKTKDRKAKELAELVKTLKAE